MVEPGAGSAADAHTRGSDTQGLLLEIYRVALTARTVDERLWILSRQGAVNFVLTARGHEIAQVAAMATLRPGHDTVWLYYRDMAAGLALGVSPYEIFLGALARADDPHSGGRQLTAHLSSPRLGIATVSSVVGGAFPQAVGAGYAARVLGEDRVAVCLFGDGATSQGAAHEAMNVASIHRLPVVFLCENNGYAISVPVAQQMAVESVADRAAGYAMPGISVDGTDAEAVLEAMGAAVERARRGEGPSLVEARVPRMTPHSSQDDDAAYRPEADRIAAVAADPLPRLKTRLLELGVLTEEADRELRQRVQAEVLAEQDRALARPLPGPDRARQWLFAGDPPHPAHADPSLVASDYRGVHG